ncbi:hypothetical protein MIR68_003999 [Amoeboaphelidium protococcarum]|nr:hypothetical protein MIR68_003999 [Amoeboaphelidium protococcarum]
MTVKASDCERYEIQDLKLKVLQDYLLNLEATNAKLYARCNDLELKQRLSEQQMQSLSNLSDLNCDINPSPIIAFTIVQQIIDEAINKSEQSQLQKEFKNRLNETETLKDQQLEQMAEKLKEGEMNKVLARSLQRETELMKREFEFEKSYIKAALQLQQDELKCQYQTLSMLQDQLQELNLRLSEKENECEELQIYITTYKKQSKEKVEILKANCAAADAEVEKLDAIIGKIREAFHKEITFINQNQRLSNLMNVISEN